MQTPPIVLALVAGMLTVFPRVAAPQSSAYVDPYVQRSRVLVPRFSEDVVEAYEVK